MINTKHYIFIALCLAITSCGGGGGSSGSSAAPSEPIGNISVDFNYERLNDNASTSVELTATLTADEALIDSYQWYQGVSLLGTGNPLTHDLGSTGDHTITLIITDIQNNKHPLTKTVTITGYSLSGTISISHRAAVDADTNSNTAPYSSNQNISIAQELPAPPLTLGGYLNKERTGNSGRSRQQGDLQDFYRITLSSSDIISLIAADSEEAVFIDVYDAPISNSANRIYQDHSLETNKQITANSFPPETYGTEIYIAISTNTSNDTATNYLLIFDEDSNAHPSSTDDSNDNIIPGDVIIRFRDEALPLIGINKPSARAHAVELNHINGIPGQPMLMRLKDLSSQTLKADTFSTIATLQKRDDVVYVEPNYIRRALSFTPFDNNYPDQWHYPLIELPEAWNSVLTTGQPGQNTIVAVLDTGILSAHPELQGQLVDGYDFVSSSNNAADGDGIDSSPEDILKENKKTFHGSHVAGIVAAATAQSDNDDTTGISSIAWGAKIMPVRVLGVNSGSSNDIIQGIRYAAGLSNDSGQVPSQHADIINLSLGGGRYSEAEKEAVDAATAKGIIVVAAAGNDGFNNLDYPGAYDNVISVGAVTANQNRASYSNFHDNLDLVAPGGQKTPETSGVLSLGADCSSCPNSITFDYDYSYGTSMATPHVSGVLALMKSINSSITTADIRSALSSGAMTNDLGDTGRDKHFGYGLINSHKAINYAQQFSPGSPSTLTTPSILRFNGTVSSLTLSISHTTNTEPTITSITPGATWLSISENTISAKGNGIYVINVDRSALADGDYSTQINITADNGIETLSLSVPVYLQVTTIPENNNAGEHYVIVISATSGQVMSQQSLVSSVNNEYIYQINNLPKGEYYLYAGTDHNNNQILNEIGEAFGSLPSVENPVKINITDNIANMNFSTSYFPALTEENRTPEISR